MKMQKTDIGVVVVMYAICAFFYSMTVKLSEDSQTYPLFTIALLFGLTTIYLVQMLFRAKKYGVESGADKVFAGETQDGFLKEIIELPELDWFVGCQFHPEFKSRPERPHPLFKGLIDAVVKQKK